MTPRPPQDRTRRLLQKTIPRNVYSCASELYDALKIVFAQGMGVYRTFTSKPAKIDEVRSVKLKNYEHPFFFRPGTSDVHLSVQTLVRQEYSRLPEDMKVKFIIDAGANIGDTAIYFLNRFKGCRLISLEPHPVFSSIARMNLAPYPNATLIQKGLWSHETRLGLSDQATGSSVCDNGASFDIECVDIQSILKTYNSREIDILKLDIEGAELEVILHNSESWLPLTKVIVAELHSPAIEAECMTYLKQRGFVCSRYRSLHCFANEALLHSSQTLQFAS